MPYPHGIGETITMMRPTLICYAITMFTLAFSGIFIRSAEAWMILLGLAPFAMLSMGAIWLVLYDFGRAQEELEETRPATRTEEVPLRRAA
jgi:hypothetical protein